MRVFGSLSMAALKGFYRDKTTLFFTFAFPLMFILLFGVISFGPDEGSRPTIATVGEGPVLTALERTGAFEFEQYESFQEAFSQVAGGNLPAVVAEEGTTITVRFSAGAPGTSATVRGVVDGVVNQVNLESAGVQPTYRILAQQVESETFEQIQHIVPGIMAFGISLAAVSGSAFTLVTWRKSQVLRRIRSAPVSTTKVLGSRLMATLLVGIAQVALFVGVGMALFGLRLPGRWWLAVPVILLGILAFFAVGLVIGALCKTEEAANGVTLVAILPMSFLSGVFMPLEIMPGWIQRASDIFPLKHMNEAVLDIWVRGQGAQALVSPSLILIGFGGVMTLIAARAFKWEA